MKITYEDKINTKTSAMPRRNKATADDFNEIKEVVNKNIGDLLWTNDTPTSRNGTRYRNRTRLI